MFVVFGCEVELEETIAFESEHVEDEAHAGKQAKTNTSKTRQSFPPLYERDSCSGLCVCTTCQPCPLISIQSYVPSHHPSQSEVGLPTHIASAPPQLSPWILGSDFAHSSTAHRSSAPRGRQPLYTAGHRISPEMCGNAVDAEAVLTQLTRGSS